VAAFEPLPAGELRVRTAAGDPIDTDLVILGIGVRPEVSLVRDAGLEVGERGGIRVNDRMQTSDPHIWAVGDVVEVREVVTQTWQVMPLAGPANRQGRIAAASILADTRPDRATGASEKTLRQMGQPDYQKGYLHPGHHMGDYPGAQPIHLKALFAADDGRLLGAQAVGEADVARRMDVIAMAIQMGATVYNREEAELCCAPQYGAAKDPVNLAGIIAANHLRGDLPLADWEALDTPEAQIVDVRSVPEYERGHIPGAKNIPLDELRGRLDELSKQRDICLVCGVGRRAFCSNTTLT
jgi:hypothetical protein